MSVLRRVEREGGGLFIQLCDENERMVIGSAFHKQGKAFRNDQSENISWEVSIECARRRPFEERLELVGLMSMRRRR